MCTTAVACSFDNRLLTTILGQSFTKISLFSFVFAFVNDFVALVRFSKNYLLFVDEEVGLDRSRFSSGCEKSALNSRCAGDVWPMFWFWKKTAIAENGQIVLNHGRGKCFATNVEKVEC